jgi:hypothetical protein
MLGLSLSSLRQELYKINDESDKKPARTIESVEEKLKPWMEDIVQIFGKNFSFQEKYYHLPLRWLSGFSFDELCKLWYSSVISMDESVTKLFDTRAEYEVVRKIKSSMWRWGYGRGTWNEVVAAYEGIRSFIFLDHPDFKVRLDYTTGYNDYGYSKFSRKYLDGVFAFLVYYKEKHVMTIGFSFIEGRRILLQQVQLTSRTGNRWLYRVPANRLEHVLECFYQSFPDYKLFVVDGNTLVDKTIENYTSTLRRREEFLATHRARARENSVFTEEYLSKEEEFCQILREKRVHLHNDKKRLAAFYESAGRYKLAGETYTCNDLSHRPVLTD